MTQKHKWAKEIIAYANCEKVEFRYINNVTWYKLKTDISIFNDDEYEFRITPKTININGHEVPEPCREKPKYGTEYFYPDTGYLMSYSSDVWGSNQIDFERLIQGLVHLTEEAATKHAEALLSFTSEEK
jgi:hypothetical protein